MEKLKRQTTFTKANQKNILKPKNTNTIAKKTSSNMKKTKRKVESLQRGQLLEQWRKEKGISKKESCHPLLSRKRSLAAVVSSPSYKPNKTEAKEIKSEYHFDRRKTFVVSKENRLDINNSIPNVQNNKRKTMHSLTDLKKTSSVEDNKRRKSMAPSSKITSKAEQKTNEKINTISTRKSLAVERKSLSIRPQEQNTSSRKSLAPKNFVKENIQNINKRKSLAPNSKINTNEEPKESIPSIKKRKSLAPNFKPNDDKVSTSNKRRTIHGFPLNETNKADEHKENIKQNKRKSMLQFSLSSNKKLTSPKPFASEVRNKRKSMVDLEFDAAATPWKNETLSRRERLDLWLAAKGKTPSTDRRRSTLYNYKSPHPKKFKSSNVQEQVETRGSSTENVNINVLDDLDNQLEALLEDVQNDQKRVRTKLNELSSDNPEVLRLANYWICKARLESVSSSSNIQNVISVLEQACTHEAKPDEKIREEICRFLQQIENEDEDEEEEESQPNGSLNRLNYAITPGRRVHFANRDSPIDFKSSIIRFCIVESTAFKRRLNKQLKRKIMTPVRRSARLRRSGIPNFLREDDRLIDSPTQVEQDIIEGNIGFVPSKFINTPLNNGWLIEEEEKEPVDEDCACELSFME